MKILVNTISTKKITGGAFQVAKNFIVKTLECNSVEWQYVTSADLDEVVGSLFDDKRGSSYFVFPTQPRISSYFSSRKMLHEVENHLNPDIVYTISSPSYFTFKAPEVMRYTNPWITNPNKYAWHTLSVLGSVRMYFYIILQKMMMRKASAFVTQTETAKEGILNVVKMNQKRVLVAPNVLPAIFSSVEVTPIRNEHYIDIACVGASVAHKNYEIVPKVIMALHKKEPALSFRFHFTLPNDSSHWKHVYEETSSIGCESAVINHGRMRQEDLTLLYRSCQVCFIPSLLEVFSATPIEAMKFGLFIVATDLPFNTQVIGGAGQYFTPLDAEDAADRILEVVQNLDVQKRLHSETDIVFSKFSDYDKHFSSIVDFLIRIASNV